jgi:7-cyano-7-deazaguanine reductase
VTDKQIPVSGPLPTPANPSEAREVLKSSAFEAPDVQAVTMEATEFTALCPRTKQPDFGTVTIEYRPADLCIESKSLKYYLWSYRNEGEFCENIAARIADDIVYAIRPKAIEVEVTQNIRGGIAIVARATRGEFADA